ncbi:uncharacterized protein LOC110719750 [Chenopodium quinoa]|uniref:uncharacterized protein LOC110719750 n=1 Tax=Chenopodium quinoa TaxID=63459 RepID=UPI000B792C4E|nr:uncharacterized protein LOC110719750 [Chenopodium quinoa]
MVDQGTNSLLEYGIPDTTTGLLSSIVRPPVTAQHFELKPQFIQFISNDSFAGTPHDCPVSHIDSFLEKCDTMKMNGVTNDAIRLRLFPFSLWDRAKEWLRDEGTGSFDTWDKLVKAFLVKFLGQEKTERLRNELYTFRQSDDESLYEAWRRFKRLQRQCPHHGGSLLTKNPTEVKELIEKMAANDNYHPGGRQNVKKGGKLDVDALTMLASSGHIAPDCPQNMSEMSIEQVNALYSSNPKNPYDPYSNSYNEGWKHHPNFSYKNTQAQQNPPPSPRPNNYNSPPGFQQRPPMNQQPTQLLPQKSSLELMMESFITTTNSAIQQLQAQSKLMENQISQLSQQVSHLLTLHDQAKVQKEQCNAVFLRRDEPSPRQIDEKVHSVESKKDEKGKDAQGPKYIAPPAYEEPMPFPQRLSRVVLDRHFGKYCEALQKVHDSTPFSDLLIQMPQFANFVKNIKDQHEDKELVNKKGPTLLYDNLLPKLHDPDSFTIPYTINEKIFDKVLCDLGASVNLMPYSLYENLGLQGLKPSPISLQMANRTSRLSKGVVEDVIVTVGELVFPIDFVVMDMQEDHQISIIFGCPFLATSQALIDVPKGQVTIRAQDKQVMFKLFNEHNSIFDGGTCLRIDATNPLVDKYVFDRNFVRNEDKILPNDVFGHMKLTYFDRLQRKSIVTTRTPPLNSVWNKEMVHERMKLERKNYGLGTMLPRIQIQRAAEEQENVPEKTEKEHFMEEFIDLAKALSGYLSKMVEKLNHAKELFPNNLLSKTMEEFIEKKLKEPSILSQDEEVFGTKFFLGALDEVEREYSKRIS